MAFLYSLLLSVTPAHAQLKTLTANTLEYPPYEYTNEAGQPDGLAIELINQAFLQVRGVQVKYDFYPWKRAVLNTQRGDSDILFNAGMSAKRMQWGHYADSVLIEQTYVLFKRSNECIEFKDYSNFSQYNIAIRRGYLYGTGAFRQALDSGKFASTSLSSSTRQSINQLLRGRVDMFIGDYTPTMYAIKRARLESSIDIVQDDSGKAVVLTWPTYLLFSKKTVPLTLVQEVNKSLENMKRSGDYQRIVDKYTQGLIMSKDRALINKRPTQKQNSSQ